MKVLKKKRNPSNRINELSFKDSDIEVDVVTKNGVCTTYNNIHYPKSFCDKTFDNPDVEYVVVRRCIQGRETEDKILRSQDGVS